MLLKKVTKDKAVYQVNGFNSAWHVQPSLKIAESEMADVADLGLFLRDQFWDLSLVSDLNYMYEFFMRDKKLCGRNI